MKIVVLDGFTLNPGDNPWAEVAQFGEFVCYKRTPPGQIVERARDADIVLTNKTPLTAATLAQLPALKFIGVLATGYDVVDGAAARARGVPVANVPVYGTESVAEFVFGLILDFHRQARFHSELVKQGEWKAAREWTFWRTPQVELAGCTLGIVGFGRIGRRVGELAAAFRMKVLAVNPSHANPPSYPFAWRELPELFAEADIVTLHCNLTPANAGMVNAALLARMKPTAFLINTARGGLVNDADLARALHDGRLAGAALDVVSSEPIRSKNPLYWAPNLTLTPHMAWATLAARRRLMRATAKNIAAFLAGRPVNVVN